MTPDIETDAQIVDQVRRGDVQAYGKLVLRYERTLLAAALPILRDVHAAQDVVQEVFVRCYVKLSSLRDGSRLGGWLLKAVGREAIQVARRRRSPLEQPALAIDRVSDDRDAASRILCDDERRRLLDGVRTLPEPERLAVSLRYFEGRSMSDIAQVTGRPIGTITKQLSRAIERLRGQLQTTQEPRSCQPHPTSTSN
jgi:RNA polymerase sigma-70 factor (ECF subfamily)